MRILITGAAGFIGSHLCDLLIEQCHEVVGLDNLLTGRRENIEHLRGHPRFTFAQQDVVARADVGGPLDRIYHLASPASPVIYGKHQIETLKVNAAGTWNLLDLALEKQARFLLASAAEVYGDPEIEPQPESYHGKVSTVGLRSMHDEAKRFAEACTMAYYRQRGADTRIVRIFNTYGPRMHPYNVRLVSAFVVQALRGADITVYGDGSQTRSLCYVSDMARGIAAAMESDFIEPINLGSAEKATVLQIAREIQKLVGTQSKIVNQPAPPEDPRGRTPDVSRARQILGWEPTISWRQGLEKVVEYYRKELAK